MNKKYFTIIDAAWGRYKDIERESFAKYREQSTARPQARSRLWLAHVETIKQAQEKYIVTRNWAADNVTFQNPTPRRHP